MWVTKSFDKKDAEFRDGEDAKVWGIPYDLFEDVKDPKERMDKLIEFLGIDVCTHNVVSQVLVQIRAKMGTIIEKNPQITNEELFKEMHDKDGTLYKPSIQSAKKTQEEKLAELIEEQRTKLPPEEFAKWLAVKFKLNVANTAPVEATPAAEVTTAAEPEVVEDEGYVIADEGEENYQV